MALLLYADDLVLLTTGAAGLQVQLVVLETFCQRLGLTLNLVKTKVMLLAEELGSRAASAKESAGASAFMGSYCLW